MIACSRSVVVVFVLVFVIGGHFVSPSVLNSLPRSVVACANSNREKLISGKPSDMHTYRLCVAC